MSEERQQDAGAAAPTATAIPAGDSRSPGAQLAERRQELNLSVEQVASRLNFAPRQVVALEADDYAALPGTAVTRGFIRAYARLLQLDPAPLLQASTRYAPPADEPLPLRSPASARAFSAHELKLGRKRRTPSVLVVLAILAVVVALALFLAQRLGGLPLFAQLPFLQKTLGQQADSPGKETAADEPVQFAIEPLSGAEGAPDNDFSPAALPAPSATAPAFDPDLQSAALPAAEPAEAAGEAEQAAAPDAAEGQLVLHVRQDSWMEIRRADNTLIFSGLGKAGDTRRISMQQPVSLKIGNAAGVEATLRGKALDLRAGQRGNVVRLNLE